MMEWLVVVVSLGVFTPVAEAGNWEACERKLAVIQQQAPAVLLTCSPRTAYERWLNGMLNGLLKRPHP